MSRRWRGWRFEAYTVRVAKNTFASRGGSAQYRAPKWNNLVHDPAQIVPLEAVIQNCVKEPRLPKLLPGLRGSTNPHDRWGG